MDAQELRNLQEAYMEVYELDEDWKPVNVPRVKTRMGNLEGRLSSVSNDRFSSNTPEYARYQRTANVVSQSTENPNKPFQKPTFDPGGLKIKPGGRGVTFSPERNSQWKPFSSRLPTKTPATVTKPSTPSSTKPNPRSISGSSAPRPGRGSTSNWMTDRMGEFTSALNRLSDPRKPNSTTKPQVKPTKSSRGGGSSAQGVGSPSGTGVINVGGQYYTSTLDAATSANTAGTLVKRDSNNNFYGGLYGNANTSTALLNSRNFSISGGDITAAAVGFDGTGAVTLSASLDAVSGLSAGIYGGTTSIPVVTVSPVTGSIGI